MSYEVKDKIYQNRWVFGGRVKFENQRAIVQDADIAYFQGLPQDFEIGTHTVDSLHTEPTPQLVDENIPAGTLGVSRPKPTDQVGAETPSEKLTQATSQAENKPDETGPALVPVETPITKIKRVRKPRK
jgi:hypothetical protein